ncbi:MAG: UPF0149 family protein [Acidobacteriaceae bacterium]
MDSRAQPALDQSLSGAEYDRLAAILGRFSGGDAMDLEEMDGFFAALICGPVTIPPSVYLDEIWRDEEAPFAAIGDQEEFLNLAMRHCNFIARALKSPDLVFIPRLAIEDGDEIPRGNRWARGFLRGIGLCREAWNEIFDHEDKFAILLPVLALAHENDPDPELRSWKTPPEPGLRKEVLAGLSVATQQLYGHFRPYRMRETRLERTGVRSAGRKIGRNEPCYCSSGKKYKHCCGDATVH